MLKPKLLYFAVLLHLSLLAPDSGQAAITRACLIEKAQQVFSMPWHKGGKFLPADQPPTADQLGKRLFAVHATSVLPEDGVLRAGAMPSFFGTPLKDVDEPPSFRPTVHFSLGEVVRPHGSHSWDERDFAIVTPLRTLESQLINVLPHDTFILGDFTLPKDAVVLVPKGTKEKLPRHVRVKYYDPTKFTLREAVDKVIRSEGGWPVRMRDDDAAMGTPALIFGSRDISSPEFFRALLDKHPHLSFGDHVSSAVGNADHFGKLEQSFSSLIGQYFWRESGVTQGTKYVRLQRNVILGLLKRLDRTLSKAGLPEVSRTVYAEKRKKLLDWMNLVEADLEIREKFGRTISYSSNEILQTATELRKDPNQLRAYINKMRTQGKLKPSPEATELPLRDLLFWTDFSANFPHVHQKRLSHALEGSSENFTRDEFDLLYAAQRSQLVLFDQAEREGMITIIRQNLKSSSKRGAQILVEHILRGGLNGGAAQIDTALRILDLPESRAALLRHFNWKLPPESPLTPQSLTASAPPEYRGLIR